MDALLNLIALLLASFVNGGGLAYFLDRIPKFKAWKSDYKPFLVMLFTAIAGILLVAAEQYAPDAWKLLSPQAQAVIAFLATWLASQLAHQHDAAEQSAR